MTIRVFVERRAVCPSCGAVFTGHRIPGHYVPGGSRACKATEKGARKNVIAFRRDGDEIAVIDDGAELTGFFTAEEVDAVVAEANDQPF